MFRHILVPVDLTPKNRPALRTARDLAGEKTRVTLLHVIERIPGIPDTELKTFYRRLEANAVTAMSRAAAPLRRKGLTVHGEILFGHRVNEIIRFSIARKVDLIIMGSRRVDLKKTGQEWGTISHKVSILAQCPVMLVK